MATLDSGGSAELAKQLIVIDPHNSHLFRYLDIGQSASLQYLAPAIIIASHQADRFGKQCQPGGEVTLCTIPLSILLASRRQVNVGGQARLPNRCAETPLATIRPDATGQPHEGIVAKTAFQQMFRCQPCGALRVGFHLAQLRQWIAGGPLLFGQIERDGGDAGRQDGLGGSGRFDAGNRSRPTPLLHPRQSLFKVTGSQVKRPGAVQSAITDNATQHAASIAAGSLDQQRNAGRLQGQSPIFSKPNILCTRQHPPQQAAAQL